MSDWQPIETAPKDGTWFMAARFPSDPKGPEFEIGAYDPVYSDRYTEEGGGLYRKERVAIYDWRGFDNFHRMTHWMPLPEPPA